MNIYIFVIYYVIGKLLKDQKKSNSKFLTVLILRKQKDQSFIRRNFKVEETEPSRRCQRQCM